MELKSAPCTTQALPPSGEELGVKRMYVDAVITAVCPECGRTVTDNLASGYLSYPVPGVPFWHSMVCYQEFDEPNDDGEWYAEHEFKVCIQLNVTVESAEMEEE